MYKQLPSEQRYTISVLLSKGLKKKLSWIIKKDYGNNYSSYCVLHLIPNKTGLIRCFTITILLFPACFSLIISIFAPSELPQNGTRMRRGTR